jgi:hypothetical protein
MDQVFTISVTGSQLIVAFVFFILGAFFSAFMEEAGKDLGRAVRNRLARHD